MHLFHRSWFLLWLLALPIAAQSPGFKPHDVDGIRCVPDQFLREFDPITLFFEKARGPEKGGPVDLPVSWFELEPQHPGTLQWLDGHTLQFSPTVAWSPLHRYQLNVRGKRFSLLTLVRPPSSISPAPGSQTLPAHGDLTLSFSQTIPLEILAKMIRLELSPLPGLQDQPSTWLTHRDFALKALERRHENEAAAYLLTLHRPLPDGHAVFLQIQVAPDEKLTDAVLRYRFQTRTPLRVTKVGIGDVAYPIAAQGSTYRSEQILNGGSQPRPLFLEFSQEIVDPGIVVIKNLVGFEPAVRNLSYQIRGRRLLLNFERDHDRSYRLNLRQAAIQDTQGRNLTMEHPSELMFFYPSQTPSLGWDDSHWVLERFGPQQLPAMGQGNDQVDLRIYKVDPLDRNFWPYNRNQFVTVAEGTRPPAPGEEPPPLGPKDAHIRNLGTPLVSKIVDLPLKQTSQQARFGLDLKAMLADISGPERSGTYLVGMRTLDESQQRHFVRIQVTDLSLSCWESRQGVVFAVTSLASGKPVAGARVLVEGLQRGDGALVTLIEGRTDEAGLFTYKHRNAMGHDVFRISVRTQDDLLILDPKQAPSFFFDNHWYRSPSTWLNWMRQNPSQKPSQDVYRAHLFSERPLYRPEDAVHLRGIVRKMVNGTPELMTTGQWQLEINGPGGKPWQYPVRLDRFGAFYLKWQEKNLPTGQYLVFLRDKANRNRVIGSMQFKKEPYRIPRFEVSLHGPDQARLDKAFELDLVADYYAGGRVAGADVLWRITRQKTVFRAPQQPGFTFSSDARFSGQGEEISQPITSKRDKTDENGAAKLALDPTTFPESGPMRYVVEAEVRGMDQQSVSTVKRIDVMPPFVLGVKAERVIKDDNTAEAQFLVLDSSGKPLAGQEYRLRLLHRQWHAYVRESDFTTGDVKYETDIVDEPVLEETHISASEPQARRFAVDQAGVYLLEMAARDHLGRLQKVVVDFFVMGDTPVSWNKSKELVFDMAFDKTTYQPGETAQLILKSPFQEATALVLVESPTGHRYHWVPVSAGQGSLEIPVIAAMARQIPVHAVLMRGRIGETNAMAKPMALASSQILKVAPRGFQAEISLKHQANHLPGATMPLEIGLQDSDGNPLTGEVSLWLVDRAVLALAREANLNPVDTFIRSHESDVRLRDTRNWIMGDIPLEEVPGGDGLAADRQSLFGKVTVRRNFKTVPYYNPAISVVNGVAKVTIPLPDNLTEFAIRAVAVTDNQRFGSAKSKVAIRLPVIVQSALPRFVRPGDRFEAGGIARLIEGDEGPGFAALKVTGLEVEGDANPALDWQKGKPQPLFFPMTVAQEAAPLDEPNAEVRIALAVQRDADGARDAFEVSLPVRPDRARVYLESLATPVVDQAVTWPGPSESVRAGTLSRQVRVSGRADLITLLAGLEFNARYPYGCTEQRVSQILPELVLRPLLEQVGMAERANKAEGPLDALLAHLKDAQLENGLFGFWPGSSGNVSLTAYVVQCLLQARTLRPKASGVMLERALTALKNAVRSDSPQLMRGYALEERAAAILALTQAGRSEPAYLEDLAALGRNLSLSGEAAVLTALMKAQPEAGEQAQRMAVDLRESLNISRQNNQPMLQDLQYRVDGWGGPLLTSEARTIAGVTQALYRFDPQAEEIPLLTEALVRLGQGDGWGSTRANAAALITLGELLAPAGFTVPEVQFKLALGTRDIPIDTAGKSLASFDTDSTENGSLTLAKADEAARPLIWFQSSYVPAARGDLAEAQQRGFAVTRELQALGSEGNQPSKSETVRAGRTLNLSLGTVIEEHVRVVNPEERTYVAISVPFAAGFDPLNPALATAPGYAKPKGQNTLAPSYIQFQDDRINYFYDTLPKGTFDFYLRLKATIAGSFVQPPASAEMMYRQATMGQSPGTRIAITQAP